MQKPDANDYTSNESSANRENSKNNFQPFPETGAYSREQWAEFYGVTTERLTDWISDHDIPVWGPSNANWHCDAEDMRAGFPKRTIKKKTAKAKAANGKKK